MRDSVAIQFAVYILSAALGSAARNDNAKRVILHKVNALHKGINESLRNSGNLLAAADDGKHSLFNFGSVLAALTLGVKRPFVNGE